ncbi:hypothetical protein MASR2M36_37990 [Providencia sp.]
MKKSFLKKTALASLATVSLLGSSPLIAAELLNSSYDIARELFVALNPTFEKQWNETHPNDKLTIKQSHAGSSKQALAILQGLKADIVTYNQVTDVQILHDKGNLILLTGKHVYQITALLYSTMAFLVLKGNPEVLKRGTIWYVKTLS